MRMHKQTDLEMQKTYTNPWWHVLYVPVMLSGCKLSLSQHNGSRLMQARQVATCVPATSSTFFTVAGCVLPLLACICLENLNLDGS